ncbi:MAG TPA: transglutaminase-like domain-containing protein, partial [Planctomycetota bacterium]|nr:transglutaminase-like domain-containing protein [Planctomycetota bacterium]
MDLDDLPELVRRAVRVSMKTSLTYYGDTVDGRMIDDEVRLCADTVDDLYSQHTPLETEYRPGSRPELEGYLRRVLADASTDREKVLAVMRFVRDVHTFRPGASRPGTPDPFGGGTEEEVIKKGSNMCNELSRVFCVLCQMTGIPARYVGHLVDRHAGAEAFVEGAWAYVDPEFGTYFLKPDGTLASAWDLKQHPGLVTSQPPEVTAELREGLNYGRAIRETTPVEVTVVANYSVAESSRYRFDWIWHTPGLKARVRKVAGTFPDELDHPAVMAMIRGERPWPRKLTDGQ